MVVEHHHQRDPSSREAVPMPGRLDEPLLRLINGRAAVTIEEVAALLGLGRTAAFEAAKRGEIPTIRVGRKVLVPVEPLVRLLGAGPNQPASS